MSLPENKTLRILAIIAISLALVSVLLFYYQLVRNFFKFDRIDLTAYIQASEWFFEGENPYQEISRRYIYPLFLLVAVYPLTLLQGSSIGKFLTADLWSSGLYLSFFLALGAVWRRYYNYETLFDALRENVLGISLLILMLHPSFQDEFINGQVNLFVMGATAGFFIMQEKKNRHWSGLFLALAASIKISPALCILYVIFTKQYRAVIYFVIYLFLFNIVLPCPINGDCIGYYRYFVNNVMPGITGADFKFGFESFSIISTLSYIFNIHWNPKIKILATDLVAISLFLPVYLSAKKAELEENFAGRLTVFGAVVSIIPLTFPMSEAHHLLLLIIPFLSVLLYWDRLIKSGVNIFKDPLSVLFIVVVLGLHIGHGLKETPIRILSLLMLYSGMLCLIKTGLRDRLPKNARNIPDFI